MLNMNQPASTNEDIPMETNDTQWWQTECEKAVRILSNLLHLAGRRQTGSAVIEVLRLALRTPEEMDKDSTDSLLARCFEEAQLRKHPCDAMMFREVCEHLQYLMVMPPYRRAMLEASVAGVVLGWGMGGG
jgi:hypothetical protein